MTICSLNIISAMVAFGIIYTIYYNIYYIPGDKPVRHVFGYQYPDILYLDARGEFQNAKVWQIISHTILMSFLGYLPSFIHRVT